MTRTDTGLLRDGYWVDVYDYLTLTGDVVHLNRLGEVSLEAGLYRYNELTFTPLPQAIREVKDRIAASGGCFLGMVKNNAEYEKARAIQSVVKLTNKALYNRTHSGMDSRMDHMVGLLNDLVGDDPSGLLTLSTWDDAQLIERMVDAYMPRDHDPERFSLACALLRSVTSEAHKDVYSNCRDGARYLLLSVHKYSWAGCFSRDVRDHAQSMVRIRDELVGRGYPRAWAEKAMLCKLRVRDYDIPDPMSR